MLWSKPVENGMSTQSVDLGLADDDHVNKINPLLLMGAAWGSAWHLNLLEYALAVRKCFNIWAGRVEFMPVQMMCSQWEPVGLRLHIEHGQKYWSRAIINFPWSVLLTIFNVEAQTDSKAVLDWLQPSQTTGLGHTNWCGIHQSLGLGIRYTTLALTGIKSHLGTRRLL